MGDQLKIVFLADTHLGLDYPIEPRVERRRRGEDFFANFRRVLDFATQTRPDLIVHGGDLFFRSRLSPTIIDMVYLELLTFSEQGIPLLIVPGNHERSRLPASLWLSAANIYVFDRPRTFCLEVSGTRVAVSGFPFIRENVRQQFTTTVADTGWQDSPADVRLLCMHQAVEGAQVGPANYTFRSGADVVRMADIPPDIAAVLSGHIHRRQVLWKNQKKEKLPVIYPGSIERTAFAEKDEPKGFFDIGLASDPLGRWRVHRMDFVELPTRPMVDIEIDFTAACANLNSYFRDIAAKLDSNAIVRLRGKPDIDNPLKDRLTASFIRSVFPGSMNVHIGAEFFREKDKC